jgi:AcrR family transcriptional regulator
MNVRKGKKPDLTSEEIKARICEVARKHFAMHGMFGASLKDIAGEAQVASSLINYHFKDKEGLFRQCVEPFARGRTEAIQRILSEPETGEELRVRLELFVEEMQAAVLDGRDNFEIIDREVRAQNPIIMKIFEETMLQSFKSVVAFFRKAQENGLLHGEVDPFILSSILFTSTCDPVRKEAVGKKFFNVSFEQPEFRRKYARQIIGLFLKGVVK